MVRHSVALLLLVVTIGASSRNKDGVSKDSCFCLLQGKVDDCACNIDTIDHFNNFKVHPILKSLLQKDYFRFFKVNLKRPCPFWPDDSRCALRDCSVTTCSEDSLPKSIRGHERNYIPNDSVSKYSKVANEQDSCDENHAGLGEVDSTISDESYREFERWQKHDDSQDNFCEMDDESSAGMEYVDLSLNPERYTGYAGSSAHRIWKSIYEENCFKPNVGYGPYTTSKNLNAMCLEKRAFYRAISGLHASINVHLCANYLTRDGPLGQAVWGPNAEEFERRFSPALTKGEGPQWLRNLYFVYLIELGALAKAAPYLLHQTFYTSSEDETVPTAVRALLDAAREFPHHFNDSAMFNGQKDALKLKEEFKVHFRNISRIMDCVGCDKCRLWGKLQVQGLGTAMKILFTDKSRLPPENPRFHLTRSEIVSLFNAFGRLSNSIYHLRQFGKMLS
ncbi:ero1-like protein isoform X2 [Rhipicephalus sanguineus]|uniref:ero1-like protein isoform X2 n=1 Tax=Rhipicephalus sanguineus TaxID=34632 RepID=UPI0018936FE3|nr:ero1-like protein isoform X2 [Rhipicephalus sanguineus]